MNTRYLLALASALTLAGCGNDSAASSTIDVMKAPRGLENVRMVPSPENPMTPQKVELGKHLFFDTRLSSNGAMSCQTCHLHEHGWTDGKRFSTKVDGSMNTRNSPTLYNLGYHDHLYWDGRADSLESNITAAWKGHMGGDPDAMAKSLDAIPGYHSMFRAAFGEDPTGKLVVFALASFVRSLRAGDSAFDRNELSADAKAGQQIYMQRCVSCHTAPLFTDTKFHNVGMGEKPDVGRGKYDESLQGAFKTPTLRNVTKTAPYFHDGSVATLREAVTIMAHGGVDNPNRDPILQANASLPELTSEQTDQLLAFLGALDSHEKFSPPKLP
ncbi:MAG: c-type cytochrome [Planctomycetes bacterium]|nr:c-type cytochrome [Planctomycetota bacterium]